MFQTVSFKGKSYSLDDDATLTADQKMLRHEETYEQALAWIARRLQVNRPDVVYIEAPLSPGITGETNAHTTFRLIGLWATMVAAVRLKGIACRRGKVGQVRKFFIGHGNLEGAEAKRRNRRMCDLLKWGARNADEADSAALWAYGCWQFAPKFATPIHPGMHQKVATNIGRVDAAEALFKRT